VLLALMAVLPFTAVIMLALSVLNDMRSQADENYLLQQACGVGRDPNWTRFFRGHQIFQYEWSRKEGLGTVAGVVPITNSCTMCHNRPFGTAGAGANVGDHGDFGRNVPHLFGLGVIEAISDRLRSEILSRFDSSKKGFIAKEDMKKQRVTIEPSAGQIIDYGSLTIRDSDGLLDLDPVFLTWLVDKDGRALLPWDEHGRKRSLHDSDVAGVDFVHAPLGWSVSDHQFSTIRLFVLGIWKALFGIPFSDAVTEASPPGGAWSRESHTGRRQMAFASVPARGDDQAQANISDIDALETYLLNQPTPGKKEETQKVARGERLFTDFGCASCHTPDWAVPAKADLRFVEWASTVSQGGEVTRLQLKPLTGPIRVIKNVYSDFRYHDLGDRFREYGWYEGNLLIRTKFRTPPLWGVANSSPYGHDGQSPTLDGVVRRHGGEAAAASALYAEAAPDDQEALIGFLESLVLFNWPDALTDACKKVLP